MERGAYPYSPAEAASALQWWADAGVDILVGDAPRDWLKPKAAPAPPPSAAAAAAALAPLPTAADAAPEEPLPDQLGLFDAWLRSSETLPFASPSQPRVCPSGDPASGLMMMIDMPAAEDCSAGALLSGPVGRLFDRMLAAIGRDRGSIYLAALSCLRSPDGGLTGAPATRCATLARHHIGLVAPKALLLFGDACSKALTGLATAQARGRWHDVVTHAGPVRAVVTLPPHHLLKQPAAKAHAWADLQLLMEGLER